MTLDKITKSVVILLFFVLVQSCNFRSWLPRSPQPREDFPSGTTPDKYGPFELHNVDLKASVNELTGFTNEINSLVSAHDFKGLDEKAREYRESKARFIGGGWKIHSFYMVAAAPKGENLGDSDWERQIEFLKEWKRQMPDSITPRTALAYAYLCYAYLPRGSGYANTVSDNQWKLFFERLESMSSELKRAKSIPDKCPEYYLMLLELAGAQQWKRADYEKVYEAAIEYESTYYYFYTEKAVELMPRMGGDPGEWESYASDLKNKISGEKGLIIYYLMVAEVARLKTEYFFAENQVSWRDAREGFRFMVKEYGVSRGRLNEFGRLANQAVDPPASCATFNLLKSEDDYDPATWSKREHFENAKKFAGELCKFAELNKNGTEANQ